MTTRQYSVGLISLVLSASLLTGCGANSSTSEIDTVTGIPTLFCTLIKKDFQKASKDFWNLTKGTTVSQAVESLNTLVQDTGQAEAFSRGDASNWLSSTNKTSIGLINFLGGAVDAATAQTLAGDFNGEFKQLPTFCR